MCDIYLLPRWQWITAGPFGVTVPIPGRGFMRNVARKVLQMKSQPQEQIFTGDVVTNADVAKVNSGTGLNWVSIRPVWWYELTSRGFRMWICACFAYGQRAHSGRKTLKLLLLYYCKKKQLLGRKCQNGALNS